MTDGSAFTAGTTLVSIEDKGPGQYLMRVRLGAVNREITLVMSQCTFRELQLDFP